MTVFYTVNTGVCLQNESGMIIIDAIHQGKDVGFSNMPEMLWQKLRQPLLSLWTHLHPDHFDAKGADCLAEMLPEAMLWAPEYVGTNVTPQKIAEGIIAIQQGTMTVYLIKAVHDGRKFAEVPLYVPVVTDGRQCCVLATDALITETLIRKIRFVCPQIIDSLFINLYQWGSKEQRRLLLTLPSKQIYLYHLPFPEDDSLHWKEWAQKLITQANETREVKILPPLYTVALSDPDK